MHDDRTEIYGLPLVHPENTLEQDVLRLREAVNSADFAINAMRNACLEEMQEVSNALLAQLQVLQDGKQDKTAIVSVDRGGTGSNTAATARGNLSVPSRAGEGASGTWGINISGAAAAVPYAGITGKPNTLAAAGITDAMPKAGGTFSGQMNTATCVAGIGAGGGIGGVQIGSGSAGTAGMSFHNGGYAINFGLDTDNCIRLGGWSRGTGAYSMSIDTAGNLAVSGGLSSAGNVTAYSDERLKTDWKDLNDDFLEQLAGLLCGTFTRTDIGGRQVGVSAQGLRRFLKEATEESVDGILSVAYGNAALVGCVKLAQRVLAIESKLDSGDKNK